VARISVWFEHSPEQEFALEKLRDLSDASLLRHRHDDYFLGLAEELDARERQAGLRELSGESLIRFEQELPSFRATLAGVVEDGRREGTLRLGAALWRFWLNRAQYHDAAEWLEYAAVDDPTLPLDVRAAALGAAGAIAYYVHDDVDGAETFWQEGLELRRVQDDPHELASLSDGWGASRGAAATLTARSPTTSRPWCCSSRLALTAHA
jgi:tetratricopeptide (TPR) repeat protein